MKFFYYVSVAMAVVAFHAQAAQAAAAATPELDMNMLGGIIAAAVVGYVAFRILPSTKH